MSDLARIPLFSQPSVVIVGGVHGAGKSTLCRRLKQRQDFEYVSPQEVEKNHELHATSRIAILRKVQSLVGELLNNKTTFYFEHVMSGHYVDRLQQLASRRVRYFDLAPQLGRTRTLFTPFRNRNSTSQNY